MEHPERHDPRVGTGRLIDSEHRARYRWAAGVVAGKDVLDAACGVGYGIEILASAGAAAVTGVDVDPAAVDEAASRFARHAAAIEEGDLRELPFADDSFDVVVCFEAIEHIEEARRAIAELRRVLRAEGLMIVSSPNPEVYLGGNEHHVQEFRPEELAGLVGESFANSARYDQNAWLGSMIDRVEGERDEPELLDTAATADGGPTYGIVLASDAELPSLRPILAMGDAFDVRWWSKQLANSQREARAVAEREGVALSRLRDTSEALLGANQELAQIPLLRHRLAELEERYGDLASAYRKLEETHVGLSAAYHNLLASKSWKLTAPLRRRGG